MQKPLENFESTSLSYNRGVVRATRAVLLLGGERGRVVTHQLFLYFHPAR